MSVRSQDSTGQKDLQHYYTTYPSHCAAIPDCITSTNHRCQSRFLDTFLSMKAGLFFCSVVSPLEDDKCYSTNFRTFQHFHNMVLCLHNGPSSLFLLYPRIHGFQLHNDAKGLALQYSMARFTTKPFPRGAVRISYSFIASAPLSNSLIFPVEFVPDTLPIFREGGDRCLTSGGA